MMFHVHLVLDEPASNLINHGYGQGRHRFQIEIESEPQAVRIELVGEARACEPISETPPATTDAGAGERQVGGLGVHIVKQLMDKMEYRRENGKNSLMLAKKRRG